MLAAAGLLLCVAVSLQLAFAQSGGMGVVCAMYGRRFLVICYTSRWSAICNVACDGVDFTRKSQASTAAK